MISHSHKFICVCNMRVASQSLSKTLSPYCLYDDKHFTALEMKSGRLMSPASNRLVKNRAIFDQKTKNWNEYFTFGFVRDPYEHFVSVYLYLKKHGGISDFKKYAQTQMDTNYSSLNDWKFTGLFDRISDEDDNIIVDFVGRFENLQDDWKHVTQKVGLGDVGLAHVNASNKKGKSVDDFYSDKEREIVRNLYKKDFEKFGYELR